MIVCRPAPEALLSVDFPERLLYSLKRQHLLPFLEDFSRRTSLNYQDLIDEMSARHGLTKKATRAMLDDLIAVIQREIFTHKTFSLPHLGSWVVRRRQARRVRHPIDGHIMELKAVDVVRFRPFKDLAQGCAAASKSRAGKSRKK